MQLSEACPVLSSTVTGILICLPMDSDSSVKLEHHLLKHRLLGSMHSIGLSRWLLVVKNLPANAGDLRDRDSIPGWGRSSGGDDRR